ncbi:serine hydrolase [Paludisphaera soli]|uniref:serine hydrolase n=1 Tax=Paludisphaera soli TaxID=2712865 RepID=UPI0013EC85E2|nr:serine hydrolase [Paludisphaera soli]
MNRCFPLLGSLAVAALLGGTPADAQDRTAEIDGIFSWAKPASPGGVVAVSLRGELVVNRAYGSADLERDVPLGPNSVFDVGSVRKQFVAAAVLLLVEDGKLSLSDDVREHFPELPDYGRKVTVDHLLTHTSGIRDWTGLRPLVGENPDVVALILRQRGLNFAPGEEWSYSNSGYVLLTDLVARVSGMSFPDFARSRLFEPLGMKATTSPRELRDVVKDRALGYRKEGDGWRVAMYVGDERGSEGGAVLSTAADLATWNDALTAKRLGAFVTEKLQEPARLNNGRRLRYARGLIVSPSPGGTLVSHSGGAAGYSAWSGRLPAEGLSIAVLCNADVTSASELAKRVGKLFAPSLDAPRAGAEAPTPVAVAGLDLDGKAGLFFPEGAGQPLRLVVSDATLRVAGGPALVAAAEGRFRNPRGDLFFMSQDEFELHFLSKDQFDLRSMEGATMRYRRAEPFAPTAEDLRAFAGRYESDEVGTVVRIEPRGDGLAMRLEHSPARSVEFKPVDRDAFQVGGMMVRFARDEAGKVLAVDYSNPVVRDIRFKRL